MYYYHDGTFSLVYVIGESFYFDFNCLPKKREFVAQFLNVVSTCLCSRVLANQHTPTSSFQSRHYARHAQTHPIQTNLFILVLSNPEICCYQSLSSLSRSLAKSDLLLWAASWPIVNFFFLLVTFIVSKLCCLCGNHKCHNRCFLLFCEQFFF